jgi:formate dehydrogenase maturation protein FdhE
MSTNLPILYPTKADLYKEKAERIKKGQREYASDDFLDWVAENDKGLARIIRSVPNLDRVIARAEGYIAYI